LASKNGALCLRALSKPPLSWFASLYSIFANKMALDALYVFLTHTAPVQKEPDPDWIRVEGNRVCFLATGAQLGTLCQALYAASEHHRTYVDVHRRLEDSALAGDLSGMEEALAEGAHPDGLFKKDCDGDPVDLVQRVIENRGLRIAEVVTALLDAGASARSVNLCEAWNILRLKNLSMLQRLLEAGADANQGIMSHIAYNNGKGHRNVEASGEALGPLIDVLMQHGASLGFTPSDYCPAIHYLAGTVPVAMLMRLLDREPASLKALNDWGGNQGILHCLANVYPYCAHLHEWRLNALDTVRALAARGCSVCDADDKGHTPLHALCLQAFGRTDDLNGRIRPMLECLLELGADVKVADAQGFTPLHCVAMQEIPDWMTLEALLDHGADVNAKTADGKTPLALAVAPLRYRSESLDENRRLRARAVSVLIVRGGFT
jgi:Ankyrin repeat